MKKSTISTQTFFDVKPEDEVLHINIFTSTNVPRSFSLNNEKNGYYMDVNTLYLKVVNEDELSEEEGITCHMHILDNETDYNNTVKQLQQKEHFVTEVFIPNWGLTDPTQKYIVLGMDRWVADEIEEEDDDTAFRFLPNNFSLIRMSLLTDKKEDARVVHIILYPELIKQDD